ncbi:5,6-dimethylbenzimidazole synthase [Raineyella fluvialis]|uniref:Nicotinate-nucleotide--dimethylbenzimidazole phosphoribosyltransferase n=1 Tax=Raineyella fluvialis TaxID=2662261 RepID=A0A5Q2FEM7_9ACTN|nr:5,6-dimethylbenzimidazole synthase [Raineyella fluvialis]QGF23934.1 5,6-dimethylbenzimidazole synthase [Raineyella fluvialis]
MTWQRPVPTIGDPTSARERAGDPAAWALPQDAAGLYAVIDARRDIRRFRPDPIPDEVLTRILTAAHHAPSVGHSQPWRFILVTEDATRERAEVMADRCRLRQAAGMDPESARRLLDLQLDGLREAPVGIVVACDRRTPPGGVLGRATFPDADLWSCATAIENLWLAARAEGLGLGWVTLFEPDELATMLHLPAGVETLGWLCVGWPDERPPEPGLQRAGWSRRAPLESVVLHERWPEEDLASPTDHRHAAPRGLAVPRIHAPSQRHVVAARDEADELLTPPQSLGVLDRVADRVSALGPGSTAPGTLVLVGADHPVHVHHISAYEQRVTGDIMAAAVIGEAMGAVAARTAGLVPVVVDAGVLVPVEGAIAVRPAGRRGDLVTDDALEPADVALLVDAGRALGAAGSGTVALGEVGVGNTTVASALAAGLLGLGPDEVVGLGAGSDAAMVDRKRAVVAGALARTGVTPRTDPLVALGCLGGPEFAVLTGVVLGAAQAGRAVILDGLAATLPGLVAVRLEPAVSQYLVAGQRSREQAHAAVLAELGLEPLLDLRIRSGEGVGACLAAGLLASVGTIRARTGRTAARP